jgi:hypothetical protein
MTPEYTTYALWGAWLVSWTVAMLWSNRTEKRDAIGAELFFRVLFYVSVILFALPPGGHYYAALALGRCGELDIGRADGCRTSVHLVGADSPWRSLVRPGGEEGRPPCRRHWAVSAHASSDLFGSLLRRVRNRDGERNFIRAARRRYCNSGLLHKSAARGTLSAEGTGRKRLRRLCTQDRNAGRMRSGKTTCPGGASAQQSRTSHAIAFSCDGGRLEPDRRNGGGARTTNTGGPQGRTERAAPLTGHADRPMIAARL